IPMFHPQSTNANSPAPTKSITPSPTVSPLQFPTQLSPSPPIPLPPSNLKPAPPQAISERREHVPTPPPTPPAESKSLVGPTAIPAGRALTADQKRKLANFKNNSALFSLDDNPTSPTKKVTILFYLFCFSCRFY